MAGRRLESHKALSGARRVLGDAQGDGSGMENPGSNERNIKLPFAKGLSSPLTC